MSDDDAPKPVFGHEWTFEPGTFDSEGIPNGPDIYRLRLSEEHDVADMVTMGDGHWWLEGWPVGKPEECLYELRDAIDDFAPKEFSLRALVARLAETNQALLTAAEIVLARAALAEAWSRQADGAPGANPQRCRARSLHHKNLAAKYARWAEELRAP